METILSQDPVGRLIRDLVRSGRTADLAELRQIIRRIASAEFDPRIVTVPIAERGLAYQGIVLGERAPSLEYHLVKRVLGQEDQQWAMGTTAAQYLDDLRRAVQADSALLAIYERRGGVVVAIITPTPDAVPEPRRGPRALPHTVVVYSADRGTIVTGYQATLREVRIPEGARWFRPPRENP